MKFIDFFAGIGGFRKGLENAGHECVGFCEWDKFATASYTSMHLLTDEQRKSLATLDLKRRQKEILKEEYRNGEWYAPDIKQVTASDLPKADCWTFGAPCFVAGTLITTHRGLIPIETIQKGDLVLTHKNRFKPVVKPMINFKKGIYEFKTQGSVTTFVTSNHRFLVKDKIKDSSVFDYSAPRWKEIKDFNGDELICFPINKESDNPYNFKQGKELGAFFASQGTSSVDESLKTLLGYRDLQGNIAFPPFIINLPAPLLNDFLEGYMEKAGSFCEGEDGEKIWQFSTKDKSQLLFLGSLILKAKKRSYLIKESDGSFLLQFTITEHDLKNADSMWMPIEKLEYHHEKESVVYNMEVEDDNSYTANNMGTHNCQDFSMAGKRAGLDGERSSLVREIFRLLEEQDEENRPEWIIYENVKGMFSSNAGLDYLSIILEMDRLGYDIEWQNINSSWFVPQNRERIYTVGHLRRFGTRKILPIESTGGENHVSLIGTSKKYRKNRQVFEPDGIVEALTTAQGGGRNPHITSPVFVDMEKSAGINTTNMSRTITARYNSGVSNFEKERSGVLVPIDTPTEVLGCIDPQGRTTKEVDIKDISPTLRSETHGNVPNVVIKHDNSKEQHADSPYFVDIGKGAEKLNKTDVARTLQSRYFKGMSNRTTENSGVAIPVLTPEREKKRQNGRRFKENNEPMFTLTALDRHGVAVDLKAFSSQTRGQPFRHGYAATLDHDCNQGTIIPIPLDETLDENRTKDGVFVEMPEGFTVYAVWHEKEQCYVAIRKLTPKECFRLQGWTDDYFEKAEFVNSDSQLYKQAGNGVTVDVVEAIGRKIQQSQPSI